MKEIVALRAVEGRGQSLVLGSLGWHGTANVIVPPQVTAADGERAPRFYPTGLLGRETEQPCTKYKATDWTVPLKMPRADKTLSGAALTCLRRRIIMLTLSFLWALHLPIMVSY